MNQDNPVFVGKKTTISELYCIHYDLNRNPHDIRFEEQDKFSHLENVDIKDAPLTIVEFKHYHSCQYHAQSAFKDPVSRSV
jgi:hypothetical protein